MTTHVTPKDIWPNGTQPLRRPRYGVQQESDGRWVVVNGKDSTLLWTNRGCWGDPEMGARPVHFGSVADAEEFAKRIFG